MAHEPQRTIRKHESFDLPSLINEQASFVRALPDGFALVFQPVLWC
jgi:hypothetical protein